jgi:F1F0 ATPase subunit 2
MMELTLGLLAAAAVGVVLALLFLLALWHSLQRLPARRHPGLWMAGGMVLRVASVTALLFGVLQMGGWPHVLAALLGFTLTRWLTTSRLSSPKALASAREASK